MDNKLMIFDGWFKFSDWNDKNYVPHELNISLSSVQLFGELTKNEDLCVFGIEILYGLEFEDKKIFTFSGKRNFSFPIDYVSIHFLSFLTELSIKEFDREFLSRKENSAIRRQRIEPRNVGSLFDDLIEALTLIRSRAALEKIAYRNFLWITYSN